MIVVDYTQIENMDIVWAIIDSQIVRIKRFEATPKGIKAHAENGKWYNAKSLEYVGELKPMRN